AGSSTATIDVCDPSDACDTTTLVVTVNAANHPPAFTADATNTAQTVTAGDGLTALTATDPDEDQLTYTLADGELPDGITLNADGSFAGTATAAGKLPATITVCYHSAPFP